MQIDGLSNRIYNDKNKDFILESKNHNKLPNKSDSTFGQIVKTNSRGNKLKVRFNVLRFPYLFNFLFLL